MRVADDTVAVGGQATGIVERDDLPRGSEYSHLRESDLYSFGDLACFSLIGVRGGKQHYKEGKQQCNEIGVGYQPALVIHGFGMFFFPGHYAAFFFDLSAASCSRSL